MDEKIRNLMQSSYLSDKRFLRDAKEADRYFVGLNDILDSKKVRKPWLHNSKERIGNPLRESDRRIASNYFNLLVVQKGADIFGNKAKYDTHNDEYNDRINKALGGHWRKTCKSLSIDASKYSVSWLHTWIDEDGNFHYGVVDAKQIRAYWGDTIDNELVTLVREYNYIDPEDLEAYNVLEVWDREKCLRYKKKEALGSDFFEPDSIYTRLNTDTGDFEETNEYYHGFSKIPFSAFYNNSEHLNDLKPIKGYIDTYDIAFSLFSDNLEDTQQIIFVLENMGGTDLETFREQLREQKAVKVLNDDEIHTDLRTLTIEVPTAAIESLMETAKKNIFIFGQGYNPDAENFAGNRSGEMLKYMYAGLDQKCAAQKDEFETGFKHFLSLLIEYLGLPIRPDEVDFIYGAPSRIYNESEAIENVKNSVGVVSTRTLLNMHPAVENVDKELEEIESEKENSYTEAFNFVEVDDEQSDTDES